MDDTRPLFLLSALIGLAGTASLAFAPDLVRAILPSGSAADVLRAVAAARPGSAQPQKIAAPTATLVRHGEGHI